MQLFSIDTSLLLNLITSFQQAAAAAALASKAALESSNFLGLSRQ
jgi:hypothetical protein